MDDWYNAGYNQLQLDCAEETGVDVSAVGNVYSWLVEIGLIDYDTEKEIIFERYNDE